MVTDHQPLVCLKDQQVLTRVQSKWLRLGLFQSIRPIIKYQPGRANSVADALSRSQTKDIEDSMDDPMALVVAIKKQVLALSGSVWSSWQKIFRHGLKLTKKIKAML